MKVGDRVAAIDEDVEGRIIKIKGEDITIIADDFEMEFLRSELIKMEDSELDKSVFVNKSLGTVIAEKEFTDKPKSKPKFVKSSQKPPMVVDLHAHQLRESTKNMTKHEILNLQVDTAQSQIEFAIRKNIQRMVFIHGVGEGVLKMELETIWGRYPNIKYYDADYKTYGFGATEVYLYQNY